MCKSFSQRTSDYVTARQRFPDFMSESPFDGRVTRRMKMAANVIDRFRFVSVVEQLAADFCCYSYLLVAKHSSLFLLEMINVCNDG